MPSVFAGRRARIGASRLCASDDDRHFLYREYIRILGRLRPAGVCDGERQGDAVILRGRRERIVDQVLDDLQGGGQKEATSSLPLRAKGQLVASCRLGTSLFRPKISASRRPAIA